MSHPLTDEEMARFNELATGAGPLPYGALRQACDDLKRARRGDYPSDWWAKIKTSGIYDRIMDRIYQGQREPIPREPTVVAEGGN